MALENREERNESSSCEERVDIHDLSASDDSDSDSTIFIFIFG
jgi:hypothetical protein